MTSHPLQRRFLAEDLVRRRRADEDSRRAATRRQGRVDPNPHQIDAVVFALQRIPEGGCILADEVGLGKTIEAGLVIAQLLAEGKRRVLVIVPKPLLGQWQNELYEHFGIAAKEDVGESELLLEDGVHLLGREQAGSERGSARIAAAPPFDLCVIDEAHEIFASIHRRYDRKGTYRFDAEVAVMAHRVREALGTCPKLLLTATPIQNSLTELWGLVQYIEPTAMLLGDLPTFRALFTDGDDGRLFPSQAEELRRRLQGVVRRTLRRQAEEFLERPFVRRQARLFEYAMSAEERVLYDDVTEYLLEPGVCAFRGSERRLLLLGFHRRMASSVKALASSLRRIAERLRAMLKDDPATARGTLLHDLSRDLEDEDLVEELPVDASVPPAPAQILPPPAKNRLQQEIERVEGFVSRAEALREDSKARALVKAVRLILERGARGDGSGKLVIFTESLTTQDYLADLLEREVPLDPDDITKFRGQNDSPRALEALQRYEEEVLRSLPLERRPSRDTAVRLALVHEFRSRSKLFISTEAGAKGLNLQFCETVVNYDLPWNPQRIEQRIGRCHRYGQERDVTVINFLAGDNEAQRLVFEILARKLDLFGRLLDASDAVLHEPSETSPETLASAFGADLEASLLHIYERARDVRDIEHELLRLSERIGNERRDFEGAIRRTRGVIETRLDEAVRRTFRRIRDELPNALERFDRDLERLVTGYLEAIAVPHTVSRGPRRVVLSVPAHPHLPLQFREGLVVAIGESPDPGTAEPLHLGHPLVRAAVDNSRLVPARLKVRFYLEGAAPSELPKARGSRGRLVVTRVRYAGVELIERLQVTAVLEGSGAPLSAAAILVLMDLPAEDGPALDPPLTLTENQVQDAVEEGLFLERLSVSAEEQAPFEHRVHRIERAVEDRALVLRQRRTELAERLARAKEQRDGAASADARQRAERNMADAQGELDATEDEISRLERRQDDAYRDARQDTFQHRYAPPVTERIVDAEFTLV